MMVASNPSHPSATGTRRHSERRLSEISMAYARRRRMRWKYLSLAASVIGAVSAAYLISRDDGDDRNGTSGAQSLTDQSDHASGWSGSGEHQAQYKPYAQVPAFALGHPLTKGAPGSNSGALLTTPPKVDSGLTTSTGAIAPMISSQPLNTSAIVGQLASFGVQARGTAPMSIAWQKNGREIPGANGASYTTPPTTLADNGSVFRVIISNPHGSVTSSNATLTVMPRSAAPPMSTKPGVVNDLAVIRIGQNSVTLVFTEVANGRGAPASYDIRYDTPVINWGTAPSARMGTGAIPVKGTAIGAVRFCTVEGLEPGLMYQFQLVAFRGTMMRNAVFGGISNIASMAHAIPQATN
jgi:hypothetical protein